MSAVRIATRGSDLALVQARYVAARIRGELGLETELVVVKTTGDRIQNVSLARIGGKGLFVKEIEESLLDGRADVAVHSAKDLPARAAAGLELVAFPQREDPRDALVAHEPGLQISGLPEGARVGTGSTRRAAQLLAARPDLQVVPLRGNVPTRIAKIESEGLAGVVLACAGLDRLGLASRISQRVPVDVMLPAVCQGTLALEARADEALADRLRALDDAGVRLCATAERAFLRRLEGDCTVPLAVHAVREHGGALRVRGLLASRDGRRLLRHEVQGAGADAVALGEEVADAILGAGGDTILAELAETGA